MKRKRIFRIGLAIIFIAVLQPPITLLLLGEKVEGIVIEKVVDGSILSGVSSNYFCPRVRFTYREKVYSFIAEENHGYEPGDRVKVIFYSWQPKRASILSFGNIFIVPIIELPIGLLIWWAFFKSFPNLYETTISKRDYAKLLIAGKFMKKEKKLTESAMPLRIAMVSVFSIMGIGLLYVVWIIISEMFQGRVSYQVGVGATAAILMILILMVQKVWKG